ncbi:MAG TPA: CmcI family methyltransferase [Burkholderiales bacterium]
MSPAGEAYLKWYYDSLIWKQLSYRGVRILKNPLDLWNYQEIFEQRAIEWVVETGTRHGGSALYFADLLAARRKSGMVISVDVRGSS